MKKRIFTFLAIAALALSACKKEELQQPTTQPEQKPDATELVEMTFEAAVEKNSLPVAQPASTKTEIKEDGTVLWSAGDKIAFVYEVDGTTGTSVSEALTAEDIKEDGSATITVQVPAAFSEAEFSGTRRLSAVYPSETTAAFEGNELKIMVPEEQDGTFAHASISSATWAGSNSLSFKNVCGLLRLETDDAETRKITIASGESVVASLSVSGAGTWYAAVLPTTLKGFEVTLTSADGEEISKKSTTNDCNVQRGHITPLGLIRGFDDRFYVSISGKGAKDGSNWDNAADLAGLKALVAKASVKNVYMATGTYSVSETLATAEEAAEFKVYGGYPADAKGCTLKGRDIKTNTAAFDGGSSKQIWEISKGKLAFDGVAFNNAKSDSDGGAIAVKGGEVKLTDCAFNNDEAQNGGALYANGNVEMHNCTFNGTHATVRGGAIAIQDAVVIAENCTFTESHSENHGGAVVLNSEKSELHLTGGKFSGCYSQSGNSGVISHNAGKVVANGVTFENNTLKGGSNSAVSRINKWVNNSAEGSPCEATYSNCIFTGNTNPGNTEQYTGGCFAVGKAKVRINDCTFENNSAYRGSVLTTVESSADVIISGGTMTGNNSVSNGGIYNNEKAGTSIIFQNVTFKNTKTGDQGLFYGDYPVVCTVRDCTFDNCWSVGTGAIVSNYANRPGSIWKFDDCKFVVCNPSSRGLFLANGENVLMLNNCTFDNCYYRDGGDWQWGALAHGAMVVCANDITFYKNNNQFKSPMTVLNSDKHVLCVNSSINTELSSNQRGLVRVNNASGKIILENNLLVARSGQAVWGDDNPELISGHNIYGPKIGYGTKSETDVEIASESALGTISFKNSKIVWDGPSKIEGFTPSSKDGVKAAIDKFNVSSCGLSNVGAAFKEFISGCTVNLDNRNYSWPGAYAPAN